LTKFNIPRSYVSRLLIKDITFAGRIHYSRPSFSIFNFSSSLFATFLFIFIYDQIYYPPCCWINWENCEVYIHMWYCAKGNPYKVILSSVQRSIANITEM